MANFLRGVSFPLEIVDGNLKTNTDAELISDHIIHMLSVEPGESPMRLQYGVPGILFDSNNNLSEYASDVARRLTAEIPQATFTVTGSFGAEGEALLQVEWIYNGIKQADLLVELN